MKCVAIISCSESSLFGDGVTLRSGGIVGNTCSEETICRALKSQVRQYLEKGSEKYEAMMRVVDKYCKDCDDNT